MADIWKKKVTIPVAPSTFCNNKILLSRQTLQKMHQTQSSKHYTFNQFLLLFIFNCMYIICMYCKRRVSNIFSSSYKDFLKWSWSGFLSSYHVYFNNCCSLKVQCGIIYVKRCFFTFVIFLKLSTINMCDMYFEKYEKFTRNSKVKKMKSCIDIFLFW